MLLSAPGMSAGCSGPGQLGAVESAPSSALPMRAAQRELLIGSWVGEERRWGGGITRWWVTFHADGTFDQTVVERPLKSELRKTETWGTWNVSGIRYFKTTLGRRNSDGRRPANTLNPLHRSEYLIERLDAIRFECRQSYRGRLFIADRVSDKFNADDL
jgi:hypothetical protein